MCSTNYLINIMLTTKESKVESHMNWAKDRVKTTFDNQYLSAVPGKEFWSAAQTHLLSADRRKYQGLLLLLILSPSAQPNSHCCCLSLSLSRIKTVRMSKRKWDGTAQTLDFLLKLVVLMGKPVELHCALSQAVGYSPRAGHTPASQSHTAPAVFSNLNLP